MPYHITVYSPHKEVPFPNDPNEYDNWMQKEQKYCIYDNPLGSGSVIYYYWHEIGNNLGLNLISKIYNEGLRIETDSELCLLEKELKALKKYWDSMN